MKRLFAFKWLGRDEKKNLARSVKKGVSPPPLVPTRVGSSFGIGVVAKLFLDNSSC